MNRSIVLAGLAALAACSRSQPAPEPTESPAAIAPLMRSANGSPPGVYEVTAPDGAVTTTTLRGDGTYADTDAEGNVVAEGTWTVGGGKTCYTPTTEGLAAKCYTEGPAGADGTFSETSGSGEVLTVRPTAARQ
ncbi:hypothetical protein [Croceibacterium aestuarii]|uniref:hypothetical protein n=1 Tax=Croceibacterium aestuarii TaxID=3064139 RepID=UPI00272EBBBA|nr:hypothetical protein [Croceibacterium sp. D39]